MGNGDKELHYIGAVCNIAFPFFGFIHLINNFRNQEDEGNLGYLISSILGGITAFIVLLNLYYIFEAFFICLVFGYFHLINIILCIVNWKTKFKINTTLWIALLVIYILMFAALIILFMVLGKALFA